MFCLEGEDVLVPQIKTFLSHSKIICLMSVTEGHASSTPMPVTARSSEWVCGRSLAGIVGLNGCLSLVSVVLSSRGLCDGHVARPGES